MKKIINEVNDITLAMCGVFALGVIGIFMVEPSEVMTVVSYAVTVVSYAVTAIGSLATGHALR